MKKKKDFDFKNGFTLGGLIVSLLILGVIAIITVKVFYSSLANPEIARFKASEKELSDAIESLVQSEKIYEKNDLGTLANGKLVTDSKQLCKSLASSLNVANPKCSDKYEEVTDDSSGLETGAAAAGVKKINYTAFIDIDNETIDTDIVQQQQIDYVCSNFKGAGEEIQLNNGAIIYSINPAIHFGSKNPYNTEQRIFGPNSSRGKYLCIDIDGFNPKKGQASNNKNKAQNDKNISPFGYVLSANGVLTPGKKAREWEKTNVLATTPQETTITASESSALKTVIDLTKSATLSIKCELNACTNCISDNYCGTCNKNFQNVNGQCKCLTPYVLNEDGNQCNCPRNFTDEASGCKCKAPYKLAENGNCVCGSYYTGDSNGNCYCNPQRNFTEEGQAANVCGCVKNAEFRGSECRCKKFKIKDITTNQFSILSFIQTAKGDDCQCPLNMLDQGNSTCRCPNNTYFVQGACRAKCDCGGYEGITSGINQCKQIPICGTNQRHEDANNVCSACTVIDCECSGYVGGTGTNKCVNKSDVTCPSGYTKVGCECKQNCECSGYIGGTGTNKCVTKSNKTCPSGYNKVGCECKNTCECSGYIGGTGTNKCVTKSNKTCSSGYTKVGCECKKNCKCSGYSGGTGTNKCVEYTDSYCKTLGGSVHKVATANACACTCPSCYKDNGKGTCVREQSTQCNGGCAPGHSKIGYHRTDKVTGQTMGECYKYESSQKDPDGKTHKGRCYAYEKSYNTCHLETSHWRDNKAYHCYCGSNKYYVYLIDNMTSRCSGNNNPSCGASEFTCHCCENGWGSLSESQIKAYFNNQPYRFRDGW